MQNNLKIALPQISPVCLDKDGTLDKIKDTVRQAAKENAELLIFGEGFLPGYPFWLAYTDGASWDLKINKEIHAHYMHNAIQIEKGDLDSVCDLAREYQLAIYLGIIERAQDRGGHSLYCSLVYILVKYCYRQYLPYTHWHR